MWGQPGYEPGITCMVVIGLSGGSKGDIIEALLAIPVPVTPSDRQGGSFREGRPNFCQLSRCDQCVSNENGPELSPSRLTLQS
jgi:hypothetical protein